MNFDTNAFYFDTSSFSNDLAGGQFLAQTGSLAIVFTNNHSPTAPNATFSRAKGISLKIKISDLAATWSDPDDDPTSLIAVDATSTNGASITTNSTFIFYSNTNNVADTFTYTIRDIRSYRPGDTIRTAVATCFITVTNAYGTVQTVTPGPTSATVDFAGVPGYSYDVQRSTNLMGWTTLLTTNTPPAGLFQYVDDFTDIGGPPSQAYYRLKQN
jgi:hypothetical protein